MALEISESTIATGEDMSTLQENLATARKDGWVVSGPIVVRSGRLVQTIIKLRPSNY
jgi:hypothetical protein